MLGKLRHAGKRGLARWPPLYRIGQGIFVTLKLLLDKAVFRIRHPSAEYVRYSSGQLAAMAAQGYRSQYGQDFYLWNVVFRRQAEGFFVDIGANHPVDLSNSYFFESQGWQGSAFEPLARFEAAWKEHRSAEFHRAAIAEVRQRRAFVEINSPAGWEHTLSAFREHVRPEDMQMFGYVEYDVVTAPLETFVATTTPIHLVMIDVEGAELSVLRGVDVGRFQPTCIMVENVGKLGGDESVRTFLAGYGYTLVARIGGADDVFVRADGHLGTAPPPG